MTTNPNITNEQDAYLAEAAKCYAHDFEFAGLRDYGTADAFANDVAACGRKWSDYWQAQRGSRFNPPAPIPDAEAHRAESAGRTAAYVGLYVLFGQPQDPNDLDPEAQRHFVVGNMGDIRAVHFLLADARREAEYLPPAWPIVSTPSGHPYYREGYNDSMLNRVEWDRYGHDDEYTAGIRRAEDDLSEASQ